MLLKSKSDKTVKSLVVKVIEDAFRAYYQAQGLFGVPREGDCGLHRDPRARPVHDPPERVRASPSAGSHRAAGAQAEDFHETLLAPVSAGGYGKDEDALAHRHPTVLGRALAGGGSQAPASVTAATRLETSVWTESGMANNRPTQDRAVVEELPKEAVDVGNGDVLIAAITSCTNTSNPSVMLAAGLLARKAVERGLTVSPRVKTSLAPRRSASTTT